MKKNFVIKIFFIYVIFFYSCRSLEKPFESSNSKNIPKIEKTELDALSENIENGKQQDLAIVLGIEQVKKYMHLFANKRVGLITNATGIDKAGKTSIDILNENVNLVALFSPEHGIRGSEIAGKNIGNMIEKKTGLPVYSLYGNTKRPTKKMLEKIDVLCFDIQDVGSRFYTYIWTLAYAMEACAEYGVEFVVFDRPNPIGRTVEGAILQKMYRSFVGYFPIAQRHGMTVGELSLMFNSEFKINCKLSVIKMENYNPEKYFDDYDLMWIPTSPNIPRAKTAIFYTGLCLFEGVNLSVGRGTTMPFEYIGAPYIDGEKLSFILNSLKLKGVFFYPAYFTPTASIYNGKPCQGVQVIITDAKNVKPVEVACHMFNQLKNIYPKDFKINNAKSIYASINLLSGVAYFTEDNFDVKDVLQKMEIDSLKFIENRKPYLLY